MKINFTELQIFSFVRFNEESEAYGIMPLIVYVSVPQYFDGLLIFVKLDMNVMPVYSSHAYFWGRRDSCGTIFSL
jgi:hypothetical protein